MVGKALPVGLAWSKGALAADQQAGLLIGLADRRQGDGAGAGRRCGAAIGAQPGLFVADARSSATGDAAVGRVGAAAGKHEFAGHEGMAAHAGGPSARVTSSPERSSRISVAASRGRSGPPPSAKSCDSALSTSARVMPSMAVPSRSCRRRPLPADGDRQHAQASGCVSMTIVLAAEAVHVERPLQPDDRALDRPEQRQRQKRWSAGPRSPDAARSTACWSPRRP